MNYSILFPLCGAFHRTVRNRIRGFRSTGGESGARTRRPRGVWRSQVCFREGASAEMKDLEFMYVFNAGGTMSESSNYDGAPPVPPAYGIWRSVGAHRFEAKYVFYVTKAPATFEDNTKGGARLPA